VEHHLAAASEAQGRENAARAFGEADGRAVEGYAEEGHFLFGAFAVCEVGFFGFGLFEGNWFHREEEIERFIGEGRIEVLK